MLDLKKKKYHAEHDFEKVYEKWEKTRPNQKNGEAAENENGSSYEKKTEEWLRWKPEKMDFEIEKKIIKQKPHFYMYFYSPEIVNEECWHGCLDNPSESIIPYTDTFWNVSSITGRRLIKQKIEYRVNWKQFNGRTFNRYSLFIYIY